MSAMLLADPPAPSTLSLLEHNLESPEMYLPNDEYFEKVPWLTRLWLNKPRRGHHCLDDSTRFWKRAIDIVGSLTLLALASPIMLLAAVLIKLTSRGSIIYKQERVGMNQRRPRAERRTPNGVPAPHYDLEGAEIIQDRRKTEAFGRPFTLYKFRTMRQDAEKDGAQFSNANDKRKTLVGKFLRKTRIDELPQLWNVLKGDMSLVGPRPERPVFVVQLSARIPQFPKRLGMKPGITGLAQVVNGYNNDDEGHRKKVEYDLVYLQSCCIWNDLKILARTVLVVLSFKGT